MQRLAFFFALFLSFTGFSQNIAAIRALLPSSVDSVKFTVLNNTTKEMTLPGEEEVFEVLGTATLTEKDSEKFFKNLSKKSSYTNERALLTHHNIVFNCYTHQNLSLKVEISTITGNIDLYGPGKEDTAYRKVSKRMAKYVTKLLKRYGFYELIGGFEGVGR